ncbi:tripartite tricarboxylate transporter substrate binding protein [Sinorhizobium mexicanum]|uniref:Tripartite tricarboxylate transporter substrate binding protein n=1 Tax=Sinorhizobium mexicanum TaxID=375549 RepID=A0A859QG81_9HYPH|nr:tripartite tricarboxylate transporter substrate binding protein [Sinorhizobium mexicanum]MBP1888191.1 tripartite-type tricarboxylate transporter receptor subunit TctC [Sinorhizobium mexicanum]QLL62964.1 tripartite tricarboxylate transporter substrate binding protein [Sinorhizobium mexicanum]
MNVIPTMFGAALMVAAGIGTAAAEYPDHPITFLIPFGAGGGTDVGVRTAVPYLERCIGNGATIVVENKPGASGQLGFAHLATSNPDGYMISTLNAPNVEVGAITGTSYTLDKFDLLGNIVGTNVTLAVSKSSNIQTLDDLIKVAKESSTPMNLGTASIAADDHLMALRFAKMAGVRFTTLPLESAGGVRNAVIGGHVQVGSISNTETAPYLDQLRVLAVAAPQRVKELPDVPTFRELGYDLVAGSNHVLGIRAGTPEPIRAKLAGCIAQVAKDPGFLEEAKKRSIALNVMSDSEVKEFISKEDADLRALWKSDPWQ